MRFVTSIVLFFVVAVTMGTGSSALRNKMPKFKVTDSPSVSRQLINTFFSVALDSLTSSSDSYSPLLDPAHYFFQIASTGIPVDPTAFNSSTVFTNPVQSDMQQAQHFAELVNHNNVVSNIEANYWSILQSVRASPDTDNSTMENYIEACNYLFDDGVHKSRKSAVYLQYNNLKIAYALALSNYRAAQNTLSASQWYIQSPVFEAALENAQTDLQAVAPQVESALDVLLTAGSSLSATMFANANSLFQATAIPNAITGDAFSTISGALRFHTVFPQPADWATNDGEYTSITISAANFMSTVSSSFQTWAAAGTVGFFSWAASSASQHQTYQTDATDLTLSLDYLLIELDRPWLDDSIFGISSWRLPQQAAGSVSNGLPNQSSGILPSYTSHILVVKNLNIHATWSERDRTFFNTQASSVGRLGFGCFSIAGGFFQAGSTHASQAAHFQNDMISAPGAQIIGYVQKIVPLSPPLSG